VKNEERILRMWLLKPAAKKKLTRGAPRMVHYSFLIFLGRILAAGGIDECDIGRYRFH
jgi:hypothetical protein